MQGEASAASTAQRVLKRDPAYLQVTSKNFAVRQTPIALPAKAQKWCSTLGKTVSLTVPALPIYEVDTLLSRARSDRNACSLPARRIPRCFTSSGSVPSSPSSSTLPTNDGLGHGFAM